MGLIKCKACGNMISKIAKSCPQCGHKVRRTRLFTWIIAGIFAVGLISAIFNSGSQDQGPTPTPGDSRKEQIEKQFSSWDGSHRGLTKLIKASMNDPKSYDHVDTVYVDEGDSLKVKTTFRGKNAFGGVVINWIWARVDFEGNVIEVISQGP